MKETKIKVTDSNGKVLLIPTEAGTDGVRIQVQDAEEKILSESSKLVAAEQSVVELQANKLDTSKLVAYTSAPSTGSGASEALAVTGLDATDIILAVTQKVAGAAGLAVIGYSNQDANTLTIQWTGNPGVGAVVVVSVKKS